MFRCKPGAVYQQNLLSSVTNTLRNSNQKLRNKNKSTMLRQSHRGGFTARHRRVKSLRTHIRDFRHRHRRLWHNLMYLLVSYSCFIITTSLSFYSKPSPILFKCIHEKFRLYSWYKYIVRWLQIFSFNQEYYNIILIHSISTKGASPHYADTRWRRARIQYSWWQRFPSLQRGQWCHFHLAYLATRCCGEGWEDASRG